MCAKDALGVDDDANNGAKARAWARNTRRPGEGRHARFGVLDEGSVSWLVNNSRVPTKFCSCRRAQRVRLGLAPTPKRRAGVRGPMVSPASGSGTGGVIRVRVEEYERLMGGMLAEAELRVAEADEAKDFVLRELDLLRVALEDAEQRAYTAEGAFARWKDSLVDAAADELAVVTEKCKALEVVWANSLMEKDCEIESRNKTIESLLVRFDGTQGRDRSEGSRTATETPPACTTTGRVDRDDSYLASPHPGEFTGVPSGNSELNSIDHVVSPARPKHRRTHSRSASAAPVAESPAADSYEPFVIAKNKEEAAEQMRLATQAGLDMEPGGGKSQGAGGEIQSGGTADARKQESSWFWPFA